MAFVDQFNKHFPVRTWDRRWSFYVGRDDVFILTNQGDLTGATFQCEVRESKDAVGALFNPTINIDTPNVGDIEILVTEEQLDLVAGFKSAWMVMDVTIAGDKRDYYEGEIPVSAQGAGSELLPPPVVVDSAITTLENLIDEAAQLSNLTTANEYSKTQNFNATTLVDAANIAWDLENNQVTSVTLAGNRTLDNPTNMVDGATYILIVKQDATGSRTLSFDTAFKWQGGTAPVMSTAANAIDILTFVCDGSSMYGTAVLEFS